MKKKYIVILMALTVLSPLTSCKKYLNIIENSTAVTVKTAADCQLLLDNYSALNTGYPYDMLISSDDYYIANKDYGNISYDTESISLYTWNVNAIRAAADIEWLKPYTMVAQVNLVLETVAKLRSDNNTPASVLDGLEGSALFYRSFIFWNMAQMYAQPYVAGTDNSGPGIPIRTTSDLNEKISRGTVKSTYDQITSDLQRAATLLPNQATVVSRPGKVSTYALLSRCYLSMSDYNNALISASAALSINATLLDYNTLTNNNGRYISARFNAEVLFQAVAYEDYYGLFANTYATVNQNLLAQYATNDLRNQVFFKDLKNDGNLKFNGSYDASSTLFIGLANDEVYLNRAECYARTGNSTLAMADLNTLLKKRISAATFVPITATDPTDALTKVLTERRKELVLRGLRWTDLRRLNLDSKTAVTITRALNNVTYTLQPNDLRYTLLIPQAVISNSTMAQNPR